MRVASLAFRTKLLGFGSAVLAGLAASASAQASTGLKPVYIHENGANNFLESVVAVRPGQSVVFVNEDTGPHTIVGYQPYKAGKPIKTFNGTVMGTKGPGHKISTYRITFKHTGIYPYYCSVHAQLKKLYNHHGIIYTAPVMRAGIHGYGGPMAGMIIVTNNPRELAINPPTAKVKILKDFFGG